PSPSKAWRVLTLPLAGGSPCLVNQTPTTPHNSPTPLMIIEREQLIHSIQFSRSTSTCISPTAEICQLIQAPSKSNVLATSSANRPAVKLVLILHSQPWSIQATATRPRSVVSCQRAAELCQIAIRSSIAHTTPQLQPAIIRPLWNAEATRVRI